MKKFTELFNQILNIGIDNGTEIFEVKKIRIINGIGFASGVLMILASVFVVFQLYPFKSLQPTDLFNFVFGNYKQKMLLQEGGEVLFPILDFTTGAMSFFLVFLNYKKLNRIAVFMLCFYANLYVLIFFWMLGFFVIFFFFVPATLPIIFYRKKIHYISFWLFTLFLIYASSILKHNQGVESLFAYVQPSASLFSAGLINITFVLLLVFFFINHFKSENIRNEEELSQQNALLLSQTEEIRAQNDEIFQQNTLIAIKNKKLTDSIHYALRIQEAMLSVTKILEDNFPEHFIFYSPRDIVSGDFYWFKKIKNYLFLVVADCTGHGVPGAFMSMLGIALLNEIVRRKEVTTAADVLNKLRAFIKSSLRQTGEKGEAQDGMDIAFCVLDLNTNKLQFSGANNPLYIFRNNQLIEYKANRQPIGIYAKEKPFTNHEIQLVSDDILYLFSDGYIDQFGGQNRRKFYSKQFKETLAEIQNKNLQEQKQVLEQTLTSWRGANEQNDDVLVVAVKIGSILPFDVG